MSDQLPGSMNEHEPSMEDILASIRELIAEDSPETASENLSVNQAHESLAADAEVAQDVLPETDDMAQDFDLDMTSGLGDDLADPDFEQSQIFGRVIDDAPEVPDITADLGGVDIDDSSTKDFLASAGFELDEDLTSSDVDMDEALLLTGTLDDPEIALSSNGEPVADLPEIALPETDIESFDEDMNLATALGEGDDLANDDLVTADADLLNDAQAQDDILSEIFDDIDAIADDDMGAATLETSSEAESLSSADLVDIDDVLTSDDGLDDNEIDFDAIFADEPVSRPGGDSVASDDMGANALLNASSPVEELSEILPDIDPVVESTEDAGQSTMAAGAAAIAAGLATGLGVVAAKTTSEGESAISSTDAPDLDVSELDDFDLTGLLDDDSLQASSGDDISLDLSDALEPNAEFGDNLDALLPDLVSEEVSLDVDALDHSAALDEYALDDLMDNLMPEDEDVISASDEQVIDPAADLLEEDSVAFVVSDDEAVLTGDEQSVEFELLQPAHDDDIDLVKSLMAELTDDSYDIELGEPVDDSLAETTALEVDVLADVASVDETSAADLDLALDEAVPDISALLSDDGADEAASSAVEADAIDVEIDTPEAGETDSSHAGGLAALVAASAAAAASASVLAAKANDAEDNAVSDDDIDLDNSEQTDLELTQSGDAALDEPVAPAVEQIDNLEDEAMPHIVKTDTVASEDTVEAASGAFANLNKVVEEKAVYNESGPRIGDLVQEALKPMLQEWLDKNLKGIVDRAVAKEIKRISSGK